MSNRQNMNIALPDRRKTFLGECAVVLAYLCFTVISSYDAFLSFDFPFPVVIVFALLLGAGFVLLSSHTDFSIPLFLALPGFRLILFFFSSVANSIDGEKVVEQAGVTFLSVAVFLFFCNYRNGEAVFRHVVTAFALVTDLQIVVCILRLGSGYDKNLLIAGIGESNYAASFLLIAIVYLLFRYRNRFELCVLLLSLPVLVLTLSFGAYLGLAPAMIIWYAKKMKQNRKKYRIILIILIALLLLVAINIENIPILASLWQKIRWKLEFLSEGNVEKFSSSRVSQYGYSWASIMEHPFFGSILNYNSTYPVSKADIPGSRTHNFVLESLLLFGLVGSVINLIILIRVIKRGKRNAAIDRSRTIFFLLLIATLIHGSLEPNYFTMHFEFFVWAIFGLLWAPATPPEAESGEDSSRAGKGKRRKHKGGNTAGVRA